jgi:hypothetical protein
MRRVGQRANRVAAALCGVGAVALLASTFLDWYPGVIEGAYFNRSAGPSAFVGGSTGAVNAWQAFAGVDLALAAVVAAGAWAGVTLIRRPSDRLAGATAVAAGVTGLGLVIWRTFDEPLGAGTGVGIGAVVAACAALTIAFGGVVAEVARGPR